MIPESAHIKPETRSRRGSPALPACPAREILIEERRFDAAVATLLSFSLAQKTTDGISLKSEVKEQVRRSAIDGGVYQSYIGSAICIVSEALPSDIFHVSALQVHRQYLSYVLSCHELARKNSVLTLELATLLSKATEYLTYFCPYNIAQDLAQTALSISLDLLEENTCEATQSMVQLAHFHYCCLYYKESEALLLRAKNIRMAIFGRVHKYVVEVNVHLVMLY